MIEMSLVSAAHMQSNDFELRAFPALRQALHGVRSSKCMIEAVEIRSYSNLLS